MSAPSPLDKALCQAIPGWFPPPDGLTQIKSVFGNLTIRAGQVATPGWESDHMVMVYDLPIPARRLYVNARVLPMLRAALEACKALNDDYELRTIGCFAPRVKRVNGELSTHTWGIAVDLNATSNPLSTDGVLRTDIPPAWVAEFEKRGWTWGGRWRKPDAMHFQFCSGY